MKALTIWQPWATLIMVGAKPYEFRNHKPPAALVGQRIVIHAGIQKVRPAAIAELHKRLVLGGHNTGLVVEHACKVTQPLSQRMARDGTLDLEALDRVLPRSAALGTAVLGEPVPTLTVFPFGINLDGTGVTPAWAWPLTEIKRFRPARPARGAQGFWTWSTA